MKSDRIKLQVEFYNNKFYLAWKNAQTVSGYADIFTPGEELDYMIT